MSPVLVKKEYEKTSDYFGNTAAPRERCFLYFIPGKIAVSGSSIIATTSNGFDTCLHKAERWKQWWPGNASGDSGFVYEGYSYQLAEPFSDGGIITARNGNLQLDIRLRTVPTNRDSVTAVWQAQLPAGSDPVTRIARYAMASKVKRNIQTVLDSLFSYAGKTENLYGFSIRRTTFTEVILLASRFKTTALPSNEQVYNEVDKLRSYIKVNGALEKYYPMMNTRRSDSSRYETMIAISIDKIIPSSKDFFISRMVPMKDRFLETDVKGGPWHIQRAYSAIEQYMDDHSLSSPARPFEIIITDRRKEADTSKWVSKLFYPSM